MPLSFHVVKVLACSSTPNPNPAIIPIMPIVVECGELRKIGIELTRFHVVPRGELGLGREHDAAISRVYHLIVLACRVRNLLC